VKFYYLSLHQKILFNDSQANPIDYNTTWGHKHWTDSTKIQQTSPMKEGQKLKIFLGRLNLRIEESGGQTTLRRTTRTTTRTCSPTMGQTQLKLASRFHWQASSQQKGSMSAQLLTCIHNSISDECALKVETSREKFKLGNSSKSLEVANGPLFLRTIIKNHNQFKVHSFLHEVVSFQNGWLYD